MRRALLCFVGALLALTEVAGATHTWTYTYSLSDDTHDAYADATSSVTYGSYIAATSVTELPTGWRVAQQTGTSPITPIPNDGDTVGYGTATARWQPFCISSNLSLTAKWEATIDAGAPANTVAQVTITGGSLFNTQAYIVRNGVNDYDINVPQMPSAFVCSTTTNGAMTLTTYGTVPGSSPARRIARNPASAGTYTGTMTYTDTNGVTHTASDDVTIR